MTFPKGNNLLSVEWIVGCHHHQKAIRIEAMKKIQPRVPRFPRNGSDLPNLFYGLRASYAARIHPYRYNYYQFNGIFRDQNRTYIFEVELRDGDYKPRISVADANKVDPTGSQAFSDRDQADMPIREITGLPITHRKDLRERVTRIAQYMYDSYLLEQQFLKDKFEISNPADGPKIDEHGVSREIRMIDGWEILKVIDIHKCTRFSAVFR